MRAAVRRLAPCVAVGLTVASTTEVAADPHSGEARQLTQDAEIVNTTVAGEADGTAVVQNPANLGYLRGVNGVAGFTWMRPGTGDRGGGGGVFVGVPVGMRLLGRTRPNPLFALGGGLQMVWPETGAVHDAQEHAFDLRFFKFSLGVAVPLMQWVPGLSLGLNYSRLVSLQNPFANANQLDLALSYRANRFVSLALVGRNLNAPKLGDDTSGTFRQPIGIEPAIAVRPLGTRAFELEVGGRFSPGPVDDLRQGAPVLPWLRTRFGGRGIFAYAQADLYAHLTPGATTGFYRTAARVSTGIELELAHVGMAAGPVFGANSRASVHGFGAKLRLSTERYPQRLKRAREVALLELRKFTGDRGMFRLVRKLDEYAYAGAAVVLDAQGMGFKWAQIEEVRHAIDRVQAAGGKVAMYLRGGNLRTYFLASTADVIWAHPRSRISPVGYYSTIFYYADLLAKLGAKAEFVRIAEYKARPEQFSQMGPGEPAAQQRQQLAADTFNHVVRTIGQDRGLEPSQVVANWIDTAPHTPRQALDRRLVDGLYERDALREAAQAWLRRPVVLREPSKQLTHAAEFGPQPEVAIVYLEGVMATGKSAEIPIVGQKLLGDKTVVPVLERLRKDRRVKAVVVRIDSVGGSVACADNIARELDRIREVKPVVISMGHVAASGGYYVATAGQFIVADATTRTGSIGIFLPKVDLSGVLAKFGVAVDSLGFGKRAGMHSWFHPYSEDERKAAQAGIQASYDVFTQRVANARGLTLEQVDALARGRVWAGVRAIELGLVDRYGGLREAVLKAEELVGVRHGRLEIGEYPAKPGIIEQIQALFGLKLPVPLRAAEPVGSLAERMLLGSQYGPILAILARLPASMWLAEPEPMALEDVAYGD